jgi:glycosyltransferase involved in cell wall biosynthesis
MKVLIVSQYFWPENFHINDVAKTLGKKGHHVEVLTGKPNYPRGVIFDGYKSFGFQSETHSGNVIHRIPILARRHNAFRLALNYLSFVISGLFFSSWLLRRKNFNVIFVYCTSPIFQAIPAIFLGWTKGIPVVLWIQDLWPESLSGTGYIKNKAILKLVEYIVRFIYRNADLLLVQSQAFIEPVTRLASNTPVKYYPNSVDQIFSKPATTSLPNMDGLTSGFSVMFSGNIGSAQAVDVIIETASLLQEYTDIHFVVLGDGSRRDWMLQEVINRDLSNFHMPGSFPLEVMPGFMQKASAMLVTLASNEPFSTTIPSKIQAYMAAGRPILASLNGEGARLVVEAEAGLAVPAEDSKALAASVLTLYKMPLIERERLGNNGSNYYKENFNHEKLLVELINSFKKIVQKVEEYS